MTSTQPSVTSHNFTDAEIDAILNGIAAGQAVRPVGILRSFESGRIDAICEDDEGRKVLVPVQP